MANVYDKLKEMNITLPAPPPKGGVYTPVMEFGDHLLYCSGCGPDIGDGHNIVGKVGGAQQPQVINGGSNLLFELFGEEKGLPARTAMGTNSCPGNIAVEIEMLVEYE